ncbi:unnamed protein product [Adineta ricciae]|uniref:G-protein coupled receptors family 1 profile domain-containing protein n=1 Tax=Adineta ricciae TaxID=249248 RepID=A0A815QWE1_ADIRI|nr:unnamed protein product [Adineta ricciae]CAF1525787.1 unnamed protein product [Adineta ricciae]
MSAAVNVTIDYLENLTNGIRFSFGLFNLILGMISNLCLITILTNVKVFNKNPSSFYLIVESYSNIGLLIIICTSRLLINILNYDLSLYSIAWCKIRYGLAQFFGLFSLFTICFTTIDQYFSTNHRFYIRRLSTMEYAYAFIVLILCLSSIHGFLFVIYSEIRPSLFGCSIYDEVVKKYLSYVYYPLISNALPLFITITFSLLSYRNVRRIIRKQISLIRRQLDQQLTAMVLSRVISLILFGLPYIIETVYQMNVKIKENSVKSKIVLLVGAISDSLLYTNFSINFFLFLIISSRFRYQVKHFIRKIASLKPKKFKNNRIYLRANTVNALVLESV